VATTSDHCSKVRSSNGMPRVLVPALLNNRSMRPQVCLTLSNNAATDAGSRTSVGTTRVRGGSTLASAAVSSSISRRRPASTTVQPTSSRACAVARPMPLPAPVTTAIFAGVSMSRYLLLESLQRDRAARRDQLLLRRDQRQFSAAGTHRRLDHTVDRGDRGGERIGHR